MIRFVVLLIILAGLVLFAVQNMVPVSLVILGVPTLAFPLAFWVLGAIGAGVLTTIAMAGLIEFARLRSRPAAPPKSRPIGDRFSSFRTGGWSAAASESTRSNPRKSNRSDDWDSDGADWDDWEEPAPRSNPPQPSGAPRSERQEYDKPPRRQPPPDAEPIPYRDPPRTDFEADQEPISRSQSGSVYSYSYRPPEEPPAEIPEDKPPVSRSNSIYDAEFRVIMPPYRSDADTPPPPPSSPSVNSDDSEWDFVDDDEGDWDRKR